MDIRARGIGVSSRWGWGPSASENMWILKGSAPHGDLTFRLRSGAIKTVGRAPRADFIVDAPLVSRLHCRITAGEDSLEVVDLSTTNGTFVNGRKIERADLKSGDLLRVGRVELAVEKDGTEVSSHKSEV